MERGLYPDDIEGNTNQRLPHLSTELRVLYEESTALGRDFADMIDVIDDRVFLYLFEILFILTIAL